ncbi:MAG: hypothetical protein LKF52_01740 [Butyrivibrio sp.]|jgi:hypothetical protein|nr:hypothetical protein [Butyrivibrio sp.]
MDEMKHILEDKKKVNTGRGRTILMILLLFFQLGICIWFGMQKQGFHQDEYYSFFSSNRTSGLCEPDRAWQSAQTIRNEFVVLPGEGFRYGLVAQVQSWDVHPPLFYDLLHTMCSVFTGVFSKWLGISVNLIAFTLCFWILNELLRRLGADDRMRFLVCGLWGCNPMTVSCVMFIRMYMWLTVFVLLCAYLHVRLLQETMQMENPGGKVYYFRFILPIMICSYLGFLTQYYYMIFFFFIGVFYTLWILVTEGAREHQHKKALKDALVYVASCATALMLAVVSYPASAVHIFRGYRGKEAAAEFASAGNFGQRAEFFLGLLNRDVFGGCFYILVALLIISMVIYRIRIRTEMKMVLTAVTGYFLVVSKTALLLGNTSNRYEMPVYGLILLVVIFMARDVILHGRKYRKQATVLLVFLSVFLTMKGLFLDRNVLFLYPEDESRIAYAKENRDVPVIIMYHDQTPDNVWRLTDELLEYPRMYFMSEANKDRITDQTIMSARKLLVYAADYDTQKESLQAILESDQNLKGYRIVSQKDMWTLYEFY